METFENIKKEIFSAVEKHKDFSKIILNGGKIVIGRGDKNPEFLFLGEAPGKTENEKGIPFCGKSGKILDGWITENNITSFGIINSIPVIPFDENGEIRTPSDDEISYFRPYIERLLEVLKPKYIICVGKTAAKCLKIDFKFLEIQKNVGFIYHPAYYLRNGKNGNDDFKKLLEKLKNEENGEKVGKLKEDFSINQQRAENLGSSEMISGILAGLHFFAKEGSVYFKDLNQMDECILGDKNAKIYTRDAIMDDDMLINEEYYQKNSQIKIFILCKKKGGNFSYIGYVSRDVVEKTRVVQMIGEDSVKASKEMRRIYGEQYSKISDLIKIYETVNIVDEKIIEQKYIPICIHSEWTLLLSQP